MTANPMAEHLFSSGGVQLDALELSNGGTLFRATLARAEKLNALSRASFTALDEAITKVENSPPPSLLLIKSAIPTFSAGGDVVALRSAVLSASCPKAKRAAARAILSTEYAVLRRLRNCTRPTVALACGAALGAGAGVFQMCGTRLVTARARLAMPEARIALVPDCAASAFYGALPGALGIWAGLTGAPISSSCMRALGLADAVVSEEAAKAIAEGLHPALQTEDPHAALVRSGESICDADELGDASSEIRRGIDACFSQASVVDIARRVEEAAQSEAWAREALKMMKEGAPSALRIALRVLREGCAAAKEEDAVEKALCREEEANVDLAVRADFAEGVRARLLDKDGAPQWEVGWESEARG